MSNNALIDLDDHQALLVELPSLTASQNTQYREEGYVFLGPVLSEAMLEELREEEFRLRLVNTKEISPFFAAILPHIRSRFDG